MDVSYVMDGAAGFMWSFVCTFIKIEIMELRDIITHNYTAEERSTTNLSIFCYREWHLLQKEIQIEFLNRRAILSCEHILSCGYICRQRFESEFSSQDNFTLQPHMMLCLDGMQRKKNFRFHLHFHFSI